MFNLIVTVLAIIIMIAVAIAGLSYLGPAFENAASKAVAVQLVNAGQQFAGAEALFKADNGGSYDVDATAGSTATDFVTQGYLSAIPAIPKVATGPWLVTGPTGGTPAVMAADGTTVTTPAVPASSGKVSLALTAGAAAACTELAKEKTGVYGCDSVTAPTVFTFNL